MIVAALGANDVKSGALAVLLATLLPKAMGAATTTDSTSAAGGTCAHAKAVYKDGECCGNPDSTVPFQMRPNPTKRMIGTNTCAGKKALTSPGLDNKACFDADGVRQAIEQSGADVTLGFKGTLDTNITPITTHYFKTALCPVNVHWHLGAEHRSEGQFDEKGTSPANHLLPEDENPEDTRRRLSAARYGFACTKYNDKEYRFNNEYDWKFCKDMHVGETYEVHWPHSALGACGTPNQYQDPFYDGVFCGATPEILGSLTPQAIASNVGVQGQVFTIVNDESYYYPDLIRGMIVDDENGMGVDVAVYSGSTTGTTRNNEICSFYSPITWQVDRKCHLISASSFDKMCADMLQQRDDMSGDVHPHGARILVFTNLTADNQGTVDKPSVAR